MSEENTEQTIESQDSPEEITDISENYDLMKDIVLESGLLDGAMKEEEPSNGEEQQTSQKENEASQGEFSFDDFSEDLGFKDMSPEDIKADISEKYEVMNQMSELAEKGDLRIFDSPEEKVNFAGETIINSLAENPEQFLTQNQGLVDTLIALSGRGLTSNYLGLVQQGMMTTQEAIENQRNQVMGELSDFKLTIQQQKLNERDEALRTQEVMASFNKTRNTLENSIKEKLPNHDARLDKAWNEIKRLVSMGEVAQNATGLLKRLYIDSYKSS